ncbi:hypothetical protein, partial [Escherichia coli]|uniref:hypothetical protein n=1 Tax=Escherichia coli TaxID=562 RepID=UPI0028DE5B07
HARSALAECRQKLPWSAPPECSCRLVLVDGLSTLPPESFARYAGTAPAVVAAAPPPAPEQAAAAPAEPAVTDVRPPPGNGE